MNTHTLVKHNDIQKWVAARRGQPAIKQLKDAQGQAFARLELSFHHAQSPRQMPGVDDGMAPVSWSAWLAELDRQNLALRVSEQGAPAYEFVPRVSATVDPLPSIH